MSNQDNQKIAVIGVGGAGVKTVDTLLQIGGPETKYIAVDRGEPAFQKAQIHDKIRLSAFKNDSQTVVQGTQQQEIAIRKLLKGMEMVVIVAGMGGWIGSYAPPEIARFARNMKIKVWVVVTEPFDFEGVLRSDNAKEGIDRLIQNADAVISLPNQSLIKSSKKGTSMEEAFQKVDEAIADIIGCISEGMDDPKSILDQLPYTCSIHYGSKESSPHQPTSKNEKRICSFCGKKQSETKKMISGPKGSICKECVKMCAGIIAEEIQ